MTMQLGAVGTSIEPMIAVADQSSHWAGFQNYIYFQIQNVVKMPYFLRNFQERETLMDSSGIIHTYLHGQQRTVLSQNTHL